MEARQARGAIVAALLLIVLIGLFIRHTELVSGQYVCTGMPPLPAFSALLFLTVAAPVLRRYWPRLAPSRSQILLIYAMLTVSVVLSGLYHIRSFLPHLISLHYLGRRGGPLEKSGYTAYLPPWYAPHDPAAIQHYFEGAPDHRVPWDVWIEPLSLWTLFFLALFCGLFSLVTLLREQWMRNERLAFPLLTLPLALTRGDWSTYGSATGRRALFMIGFGIAAGYNGMNIWHAFVPSVPRLGFTLSLSDLPADRPWNQLRPVTLYFMLDAIGIGYFVPLELAFSVWFFYLLNRAVAVVGASLGQEEPGYPFTQEQSAGGYMAIALVLLWRLRHPMVASFRRAWLSGESGELGHPERWAWIGLAGSTLFLLAFLCQAGLSLAVVLPFFGVMGLFVLVYARIRAETGVPFQFVYPFYLPKELTLNLLSVPQIVAWGGARSMVLLSSLAWMSTNHHPLEEAAYQFDSAKLGSEGQIPYRTLFLALLLAFAVGLVTAYWAHLSAYYTQGSNLIPSAGGIGEYRAAQARQEYQQMAARIASLTPRNLPRLLAAAGGFGFAAALLWLRSVWHGSPFHPLGFVIATAFGDTSTSWFPMLIAWLAKFAILRVGGLRLYRQGMPFFLGLTIGHFLVGGVIWPLIGQFISREAANSYHLLFGE